MASKRGGSIAGFASIVLLSGVWIPEAALAATVTFQNGTATCSQNDGSGNFAVDEAIDGVINNSDGWAIFCGAFPVAQTAVFETASDVTAQNLLIFQLSQMFFNPHTIGKFRISATTAPRADFADGLNDAGDLGMPAIWTVLDPTSVNSTGTTILTEQGDNSILASGPDSGTATYTVIVPNSLSPITGIRLEVLEDPSLPFNGPGRQSTNGNFVLTELTLHAEECVVDQLDIDNDDGAAIGPLTDALLILRNAFDFTGSALISGATGQQCDAMRQRAHRGLHRATREQARHRRRRQRRTAHRRAPHPPLRLRLSREHLDRRRHRPAVHALPRLRDRGLPGLPVLLKRGVCPAPGAGYDAAGIQIEQSI